MDGLSRASGAGATVDWNGKSYRVGSFGLEDWGAVEAHLIRLKRKQKMQVVIDLRDDLPADLWNEKYQEARREAELISAITPEEVMAWVDTREGACFTLHLLLDRQYPGEFKLSDMLSFIHKMKDTEFDSMLLARDQAAGLDTPGNSTGQPTETTTAAAQTEAAALQAV